MQLSLFDHVKAAYAKAGGPLSNDELYDEVARSAGVQRSLFEITEPVGKSKQPRSLVKRAIRWHQQTLKQAGLLESTGRRGEWDLTRNGKVALRNVRAKSSLVAFSTNLGAAIWSLSDDVFSELGAPITLCLTSPPYPLRVSRAYGNPDVREYIQFIVESLRPIAANLVDGGSICLNVSNDIFEPNSPARSMYRERLVLALADELGLWKLDELIWENPCKPPGPIQYASKTRQQLNTAFEPIYWFSNNPVRVKADNRRVLIPHTERHMEYIRKGGAKESKSHSDGAYRIRKGSFSNETPGRIPRNILRFPHNCPSQSWYKKRARELGLPPHGAPYPLALATFLIRFLSEENDLVVDPFSGSLTTGLAAELANRRWILTECMYEYLRGGGERFYGCEGFEWTPDFLRVAS
jgi:site-specific DNA-methyltransferase (cytosine-N4-specific)